MAFQYAGASATGKSHLDAGTPCEDAWQVQESEHGLVAVVCDGAGSAARSGEGARLLSERVCTALMPFLDRLESPAFMLALTGAIEATRQTLASCGPLADFHATLCGVAMGRDQSVVFHLGDGIALGASSDSWKDFVVSEPENGEYAEITYFFTLPDWRDHLRVFSAPEKYRTWFLMSDGTASFAVKTAPWRPTSRFLVPVDRHLANLEDTASRNQALLSTLYSPDADRITIDDKTLVWLNEQRQS